MHYMPDWSSGSHNRSKKVPMCQADIHTKTTDHQRKIHFIQLVAVSSLWCPYQGHFHMRNETLRRVPEKQRPYISIWALTRTV